MSREETSTLIFGTRAVIEAIKAGKELDKIMILRGLRNELIKELMREAKDHQVPITQVPEEKLQKFTKKNHQGVLAFVSPVQFASVENIIDAKFQEGKMPFLLVLDRITDVRNFGAICRTALSAGVDAVVITSKGSAQINADAVKTSAGALHHIPICRSHALNQTLRYLKDCGLRIVGCTEKAKSYVFEADLNGPLALVMGSEEDGLSDFVFQRSDELVKLPMMGEVASLNVSAATAAILFEAVRQRGNY
jgi:23S rRNA (guanosine2251-2'-O)-methyltransferase